MPVVITCLKCEIPSGQKVGLSKIEDLQIHIEFTLGSEQLHSKLIIGIVVQPLFGLLQDRHSILMMPQGRVGEGLSNQGQK